MPSRGVEKERKNPTALRNLSLPPPTPETPYFQAGSECGSL